MPSPSPRSSQRLRWRSVACKSRGNQVRGTVSVRASCSSTISSSRVVRTLRARALESSAKVLTPTLHKGFLVPRDQSFDLPELAGLESRHAGQPDRPQPELRQTSVPLDMDVWRLGPFVAVEE